MSEEMSEKIEEEAIEETIDRFVSREEAAEAIKKKAGLEKADLSGLDLAEMKFTGLNAEGINLSNANLMLSRQGEIDTKPQLEILADDVQCSHGTTVGQLNAEALYYLRSRGLSEIQARRMLCLAFADEILQRFDFDSLRQQLTKTIRQQVEGSIGKAA